MKHIIIEFIKDLFYNRATGDLIVGGAGDLIVSGTGNIGIGVTPTATLDVGGALGNAIIRGGLSVGHTTAPQPDRISIGDPGFQIQFSTAPFIQFDSGDFFQYNRTSNFYSWRINSVEELQLNGTRLLVNGDIVADAMQQYSSVTLTTDNTSPGPTILFRPFDTDAYGGTLVTNASNGVTFVDGYFQIPIAGTYQVGVTPILEHSDIGGGQLDHFRLLKNESDVVWNANNSMFLLISLIL